MMVVVDWLLWLWLWLWLWRFVGLDVVCVAIGSVLMWLLVALR